MPMVKFPFVLFFSEYLNLKLQKAITFWISSYVIISCLPTKIFASVSDTSRIKIGILPIAFYAPETSFGIGGIFYTHFTVAKSDTTSRKSTSQTYLSVTLNKQLLFQNDYSVFTRGSKFYFKGRIDYIHFPEYFYGVGNTTSEDTKCLINFNSFFVSSGFYKSLTKDIYAGLLIKHQSLYMLNKTLMNYTDNREIYGSMGYNTSGIGAGLLADKRDNQLNPQKGYYVEINYFKHVNYPDMRTGFNSLVIDLRGYKGFLKKLVLAVNAYGSFNQGEVPFRLMPYIGGPRFLRGYYMGRFRDNNLIILQQEFRYPLFGRFGVALFSGAGQVARELNNFDFRQFHYSCGAGLRFKIDRKENTNVRLDFGFTKDSNGIYIVFAEAF